MEKVSEGGGGGAMPLGSYGLLGSVVVDGGNTFGVSCAAFDGEEELVWTGNGGGHLTSYYGPGLHKYSSFQASDDGAVVDLATLDSVLLSLSAHGLHLHRKTGPALAHFTSPSFLELSRLQLLPDRRLILGGLQESLIVLDPETGQETAQVDTPGTDCVVMRLSDRHVLTGDSEGRVVARDPRSLEPVHAPLTAHGGLVADMDVRGHSLVSVGGSLRFGSLSRDNFIKVYDLRNFRCLTPVSNIPFPPAFVRFLPLSHAMFSSSDSRLLIGSGDGLFGIFEMGELAESIPINPEPELRSQTTALHVSSSRQCLAFGDLAGFLHIFSDSAAPAFNAHSQPSAFADPVYPLGEISYDDDLAPLSVVPAPFSADGTYLSDWPPLMSQPAYRQPLPLPQAVLDASRQNGFVACAPMPDGMLRNQVNYDLHFPPPPKPPSPLPGLFERVRQEEPRREQDSAPPREAAQPLFRHAATAPGGLRVDSGRNSPAQPGHGSLAGLPRVPRIYRRLLLKRTKLTAEDFNYRNYNSTPFSGLDFSSSNAYVCPLLLALYHQAALRQACLGHLCRHEFCLACEFSFLSGMLTQAGGTSLVAAKNLIRALRAHKETSFIVGDEDSAEAKSLDQRITLFARFFLQKLFQDLSRPGPRQRRNETADRSDGDLSGPVKRTASEPGDAGAGPAHSASLATDLVASQVELELTCPHCQRKTELKDAPLLTPLQYPRDEGGEAVAFGAVLRRSLNGVSRQDEYCEGCEQRREMSQRRRLRQAPPLLLFSVPNSSDKERAFLERQQKWWPSARANPLSPGQNAKPCRYGANCNRPDCRFSHSKPPLPSLLAPEALQPSTWLDASFSLAAEEGSRDYRLAAAVFLVKEKAKDGSLTEHLVAAVRTLEESSGEPKDPKEKPWTIFNEVVVGGVSEEEALEWSLEWKVPVLLLYRAASEANPRPSLGEVASPITEKVFWEDEESVAGQAAIRAGFQGLSPEELPEPGSLVGLDAEFVGLSEGMSVARVSAIRGFGPLQGTPFIDDYISTSEEVENYHTKFSGIQPGDLHAKSTTKHLTTLKTTYLKLRWLVERGCRLVGHGLANDFRVINIVVPQDLVLDTVHLFHQPSHRMVSLRFLSWHFFESFIQADTHDSVEDARAALRLYQHYEGLKAQGPDGLQDAVRRLYARGHQLDWKVPGSDSSHHHRLPSPDPNPPSPDPDSAASS